MPQSASVQDNINMGVLHVMKESFSKADADGSGELGPDEFVKAFTGNFATLECSQARGSVQIQSRWVHPTYMQRTLFHMMLSQLRCKACACRGINDQHLC